MKARYAALILASAFALPAAAQNTTTSNGQVVPTTAAPMKIKVAQSLASTARISADSAYAIARRKADNGQVSSGELVSTDGRLLYNVHVLNGANGASTVKIDAMTGEVFDAQRHGGLKASAKHHKESKKLEAAKRDSAATRP